MNEGSATGGRTTDMVLVKGDQKYIFRYTPGSEATLISQLMDLAEDETSPIGWVEVLLAIRRFGL